ncbi:hypothetical protein [Soonwooa sp.]|uniref:hypothetical protein n=1 Tax=Soonwooa sp. TaxID=1938592 RepID=UPI002635712A|nr:hypothetical protein [Soonwooa sp.]
MKLVILFMLLCFSNFTFSQVILSDYPVDQFYYKGGNIALQKDLSKAFKDLELKPCDNTMEAYNISVLIEKDSSIKFIKDMDSVNVEKNKCAFTVAREIIPELKFWQPAEIQGQKFQSIAKILINPFQIAYSTGEGYGDNVVHAQMLSDADYLHVQLKKIFQKTFRLNMEQTIYLSFTVTKEGLMKDFVLDGNYDKIEVSRIITDLKHLKLKWKPATFNGVPMDSKQRINVNQLYNYGELYNND